MKRCALKDDREMEKETIHLVLSQVTMEIEDQMHKLRINCGGWGTRKIHINFNFRYGAVRTYAAYEKAQR